MLKKYIFYRPIYYLLAVSTNELLVWKKHAIINPHWLIIKFWMKSVFWSVLIFVVFAFIFVRCLVMYISILNSPSLVCKILRKKILKKRI